jgi:hypothetical protein
MPLGGVGHDTGDRELDQVRVLANQLLARLQVAVDLKLFPRFLNLKCVHHNSEYLPPLV